ncbi:sporulation protein SsgA [Streptomyces sp. CB02959]|uniref:plasmid transfer protein TraA n=1 Tax=Streptomyces sp. CB02959 TaxID=2020330 RepID=UPI000C276934|nr:plasmid transfer protein TraA [Streptomyces sp. CB02959]PJN40773.1 sporulation protein SsgA [Streptomyces sp. CB02959]
MTTPGYAHRAPGAGANGSHTKTDTNKASTFASFAPGFTVNINKTTNGAVPAQQGGGGPASVGSLMPAPEFTSPAQVRDYCNSLRSAAVTLSIEVAMAAEIMKAVLSAVPDPEGRIGGSKIRAFKVAHKLQKSADALRDAAKNAGATYALFQQQYEEEINRVRHRARRPQTPRMDWAQQ